MARSNNAPQIWLGYEDESITEKYKGHVNFTTNKIGGKPDFPKDVKIDLPLCSLCQLPQPLVVQIYAPLENSSYHRTLYLFACINPNCWNHSESWTCLRSQTLEQITDVPETTATATSNISATDWCEDADDWDDNNSNFNEENGNLISNVERASDEDDESCSFEECIRSGLGNLSVDDRNANTGLAAEAQGGGAVGRLHSPAATAEIEGDEGEVISIDTPTGPQYDIAAMLQEVLPLPQDICQNVQSDSMRTSNLHFVPYFMSVWEETGGAPNGNDRHVRELLQEYQQRNKLETNTCVDNSCDSASAEKYEKSNPAHGDKMFHHFLSRVQMNPGQILRYSRDGAPPLLLYPLQEVPKKCQYCHGETVFEFQILSTIIPKLKLFSDKKEGARLEFGTVLVFTCKKNCWSTDSVVQRESVVVQTEIF